MIENINLDGVTSKNWKKEQGNEIAPDIFEQLIWQGTEGKKALIYEFKAGAVFPGLDSHDSGPEQIYVISGTFNDGVNNYEEGSFIHNPKGTAHIPQSKTGCTVLVLVPEG
jgi:anti-sigma factor ChrR (cupin superfamily)